MAKLKNIVHSDDSCMMIFKGDISKPEPSAGIIKFPGGFVEVSRCSDGSYYAHIQADTSENAIDSRIDYDYDGYLKNGIPDIPDHKQIKHLAIKIKGPYITNE